MLGPKTCSGLTNRGQRCRGYPLPDAEFCTFHDPRYEDAVAEGQRRRREGTLAATYDVTDTRSMDNLQRLLDIASYEALALDNSVAKVRAIVAVAQTGAKLLEVGEMEERLAAIESTLGPRVVTNSRKNGKVGLAPALQAIAAAEGLDYQELETSVRRYLRLWRRRKARWKRRQS